MNADRKTWRTDRTSIRLHRKRVPSDENVAPRLRYEGAPTVKDSACVEPADIVYNLEADAKELGFLLKT
jgi:hypothetical protein